MEALGRLYNHIHLADAVYINAKAGGTIAFLCYLAGAAGDTYTLTEAKTAAGGSAQVLACITRYYTCTGTGVDTWTKRTQAAGSTVITAAAATQNCMVVEVNPDSMSDGYRYLKLTSTGAGLVTVMALDLKTQRAPGNLAALGA